ncbi:MAG: HTTM domain-containing protein, partial [Nevskia sp.]
ALVVAFVLNASLLNRNPMVLLGGDILLTCLLFWAIFLPVAARYSLDAALSRTPPPVDNRHRSWASAGVLLQVMSVYFFSA